MFTRKPRRRPRAAEPTDKLILVDNDGFKVYGNGGRYPSMQMSPGRFVLNGREATPQQLARGWMDADDPTI